MFFDYEEEEIEGLSSNKEFNPNTQDRYYIRQRRWVAAYPRTGWYRHAWWWFFHNSIVHVILGIIPCKHTHALHDWASDKLNMK